MVIKAIIILLAFGFAAMQTEELIGLQFWANLLNRNFFDSQNNEQNNMQNNNTSKNLKGYSTYVFFDYITYKDQVECGKYDEAIQDANNDSEMHSIKVKCVLGNGNGTVHIINSVQEVISTLKPHGNATKRTLPGNCALVLFYTSTCPKSAQVAPHYNALARQFPGIKIAAIDAFQFTSFSYEFGVVSVPTILLFHQGRPILKFNGTSMTLGRFVNSVTQLTDIKPFLKSITILPDDYIGPLSNKVEEIPDKVLYLAWAFIILCAAYYFTKTNLYRNLIEIFKRNWRESEAQLEN